MNNTVYALLEEAGQLGNVRLGHLQRLVLGELVLGAQPRQHVPQPVKAPVQQVHPPPFPRIGRQPSAFHLRLGQVFRGFSAGGCFGGKLVGEVDRTGVRSRRSLLEGF